jgi:hypothetical protein
MSARAAAQAHEDRSDNAHKRMSRFFAKSQTSSVRSHRFFSIARCALTFLWMTASALSFIRRYLAA